MFDNENTIPYEVGIEKYLPDCDDSLIYKQNGWYLFEKHFVRLSKIHHNMVNTCQFQLHTE